MEFNLAFKGLKMSEAVTPLTRRHGVPKDNFTIIIIVIIICTIIMTNITWYPVH